MAHMNSGKFISNIKDNEVMLFGQNDATRDNYST